MKRMVWGWLCLLVLLGLAQDAVPAPEMVHLPNALFWCLRWEWES